MDKKNSGSRNCRNGVISGSRNRRKGREILYQPEPDKAQQYFLTKLRRIATRGVKHLEVIEKRWAKGEELVTWYKSFRKIANTRGPGQTVLNLQLGTIKMEKEGTQRKISSMP